MSLLTQPKPIIHLIGLSLNRSNLLNLQLTCKKLSKQINDENFWKNWLLNKNSQLVLPKNLSWKQFSHRFNKLIVRTVYKSKQPECVLLEGVEKIFNRGMCYNEYYIKTIDSKIYLIHELNLRLIGKDLIDFERCANIRFYLIQISIFIL